MTRLDYVRRLKIIGLQSLENRELTRDLSETSILITGKEKVNASDFCNFIEGKYELREHKKSSVERSRLEIRMHFFRQSTIGSLVEDLNE